MIAMLTLMTEYNTIVHWRDSNADIQAKYGTSLKFLEQFHRNLFITRMYLFIIMLVKFIVHVISRIYKHVEERRFVYIY